MRITLSTYLHNVGQFLRGIWVERDAQSRRGGNLRIPSGPFAVAVRLGLGRVKWFVLRTTRAWFKKKVTGRMAHTM